MKTTGLLSGGARGLGAATLSISILLLAGCGGGGDQAAFNEASVTLDSAPSLDAAALEPSAPGTARLSWEPAAGDVASYRVYFGEAPGAYEQAPGAGIEAGNATSYSVKDLVSGQAYYFAVASVDSTGRQSGLSDEVKHVVP